MAEGAEAWSWKRDCAVGVMPEYSDPSLVVVDCDSDLMLVPTGRNSITLERVYGIDQLSALCREFGEEFPATVVASSAGARHGHLYFRQNSARPVRSTKIKPRFLALDVKATGYVVHWSAPERSCCRTRRCSRTCPRSPGGLPPT